MQTSIGIYINWIFVVVTTVVLIILIIVNEYRRGERGLRFLAFTMSKIAVAFIAWQILFFLLVIITYAGGGTASELFFRDSVSNVVAYLVVIVVLFYLENKRSTMQGIEDTAVFKE